jgi:ABC-type branched-subunit amino acid transport system substrate-binding protein
MARLTRRRILTGLAGVLVGASLSACGSSGRVRPEVERLPPAPSGSVERAPIGLVVGQGSVNVGLLLPTSANGNAGQIALSMKNAAEMALAEFQNPDIQLIVKDDGGTAQGAQNAAAEAIKEGAEIILGPVFAHSVGGAAQAARQAGVPIIAFSTDTNAARPGVYLLSFLPESDVRRIVEYAASQGKRSFAALIPETGYGTVVEAELQQAVTKAGGRIVALEHYPLDKVKMAEPIARIATALPQADALIIPDAADSVPTVVGLLAANGIAPKRVQLLGTGLWDDPGLFREASLSGAWFAAPDSAGFRAFAQRYRTKYGSDPVRTASLSYDAVALVAALAKTQGSQRFSQPVLTNPSGFAGIDGVFRFRSDGLNERGLAVMVVRSGSDQVLSPAPHSFGGSPVAATQ